MAGEYPFSDAFFGDLARVLQVFEQLPKEDRPKVLLMIDELETLQDKSPERTMDLLRNARGLQNRYQEGFAYIITAANPSICEKGQIDGKDNPVFGCIRPLYLEFLRNEECAEMITELGRGMGVSFDSEAVKRVYTATAGHPSFTRYLCSIAVGLRRGRPVKLTKKDIIQAEAIYNRQRSGDDLSEIEQRLARDYPEELAILKKLAASDAPIPLTTLLPAPTADERRAIRHLLGYQLAEETRVGIALRMELFRRYLTGHSKGPSKPKTGIALPPASVVKGSPRHPQQRRWTGNHFNPKQNTKDYRHKRP